MNPFVKWLEDTGQRASRTFVQTLVATGLVDSVNGLRDWKADFTIAGLAAAASVAHAVIDNVSVTPSGTTLPPQQAPALMAAPKMVTTTASSGGVDVTLSTSAMGVEPPSTGA